MSYNNVNLTDEELEKMYLGDLTETLQMVKKLVGNLTEEEVEEILNGGEEFEDCMFV